MKPAEVLLDLLRGARPDGRKAAYLIDNGRLFGFTENMVRVTLSRLCQRGLVTSPARGRYRLATSADPVNRFVERWRDGEALIKPWTEGTWLIAHSEQPSERTDWVLSALGFQTVRPGLLARPDNLIKPLAYLNSQATAMGMKDTLLATCFLSAGDSSAWQKPFNSDDLNRGYRQMFEQLEHSLARLPNLTRGEARLESFTLGGAGINLLAKDPWLPSSMIDQSARRALWQLMLDYDRAGRNYWTGALEETDPLPVRGLAQAG